MTTAHVGFLAYDQSSMCTRPVVELLILTITLTLTLTLTLSITLTRTRTLTLSIIRTRARTQVHPAHRRALPREHRTADGVVRPNASPDTLSLAQALALTQVLA